MSISSISSLASTSAVSSVQFQAASQVAGTDSTSGGDTTAMSSIGKFMTKLSALEQSDPAQAKQVLSTIASKLNDAASTATGDQATHLKDLAAKFSTAADTGDLSGIQPPQGGGQHHHHHHHAAAASSSSDPSTSDSSGSPGATAMTEQYKQHAAKPDMQALDQMFEDAFNSVTGTTSAAS
jgi:hypothetical protein